MSSHYRKNDSSFTHTRHYTTHYTRENGRWMVECPYRPRCLIVCECAYMLYMVLKNTGILGVRKEVKSIWTMPLVTTSHRTEIYYICTGKCTEIAWILTPYLHNVNRKEWLTSGFFDCRTTIGPAAWGCVNSDNSFELCRTDQQFGRRPLHTLYTHYTHYTLCAHYTLYSHHTRTH